MWKVLVRRLAAALSASLVLLLAIRAQAQPVSHFLVGPAEPNSSADPARPRLPEFRIGIGDLREPGAVRRNGLIAAYPLRENLHVGVGRFTVPALPRPRTHMESDRAPTAARPRDGRVAAIGISVRF